MKKLIVNYSFDASEKKITFSDYASISLEGVLIVTNVTDNEIIYLFNNPLTLTRKLVIRRTIATVMTGVPNIIKHISKIMSLAIMRGIPVMARKLDIHRTFESIVVGVPLIVKKVKKPLIAVMIGIPTLTRKLVIRRTFAPVARFIPKSYLKITFDIMNRITGGGTTIIKKIINIFDD